MSALSRAIGQMFGGPAIKSSAIAMAGGAAGGLGVGLAQKGVGWLVNLLGLTGTFASAAQDFAPPVLTGVVGGGLLRQKSATAAAGLNGAMGYVIGQKLVNALVPEYATWYGLQGTVAQQGVGSFLDRLDAAGRRLGGSIAQPQATPSVRQLAGSVAQSLGGTAYGGRPVSVARVGIRGGGNVGM